MVDGSLVVVVFYVPVVRVSVVEVGIVMVLGGIVIVAEAVEVEVVKLCKIAFLN